MKSLELIKWFSINQMKANPEKFQAIAVMPFPDFFSQLF
jgi:hypothetical protein